MASSKVGLSPGTLIYVGPTVIKDTTITMVEYNEKYHKERTIEKVADCHIAADASYISWLDVDGIHEPEVIEAVGQIYHIHPLLLEDIMNTRQKPKIEF